MRFISPNRIYVRIFEEIICVVAFALDRKMRNWNWSRLHDIIGDYFEIITITFFVALNFAEANQKFIE